MATIQHPAFPSDTREVLDADVADWAEQGWITAGDRSFDNGGEQIPADATEIRNVTDAPAPVVEVPAPKPGPRDRK